MKDKNGNNVVDEQVNDNNYTIKLNTEVNKNYELSISCEACKTYHKPLVFVEPPALPFDNKLEILSALSLDEDNNWRLEVWRQLATMPESQARKNLQNILKADCLDIFIKKSNCKD